MTKKAAQKEEFMKKKLTASVLAVASVLSMSTGMVFADETTAEVPEIEMADASEVDKTTISFWHSMGGVNGQAIDTLVQKFNDENAFNMGAVDLFSQDSRVDVNLHAVKYLNAFSKLLKDEPSRNNLVVSDSFNLQFRVMENDNDTGWVEKIANVGSDGTDILVKAMVNIMLINVFKEKASRKFGDFKIHCMMDEIGKLHPNNVKGILDFANCRNILLVNSSPTTYNVEDYRYTYLLSKDGRSNTQVVPLLTYNKIEK